MAQQQPARLQKAIVQYLHAASRQRRHDEAPGTSYTALVQAMTADRGSIIAALRQLMRRGLVQLILPRGAWTRYAVLTDEGRAYAKTLAPDDMKPALKKFREEVVELVRGARHEHASARQSGRERHQRTKRDERRVRRRDKRDRT